MTCPQGCCQADRAAHGHLHSCESAILSNAAYTGQPCPYLPLSRKTLQIRVGWEVLLARQPDMKHSHVRDGLRALIRPRLKESPDSDPAFRVGDKQVVTWSPANFLMCSVRNVTAAWHSMMMQLNRLLQSCVCREDSLPLHLVDSHQSNPAVFAPRPCTACRADFALAAQAAASEPGTGKNMADC